MKATKQGIEINKTELGTLLYFAGKADSAAVKFRIDAKGKLFASATDGKRGVECESAANDAVKGEWLVPSPYLEMVRRGLNMNRTEALLPVNAKGLNHAVVRNAISRAEQQEVVDKTSGTSTQVSMESLHRLVKDAPLSGTWFAIVPKQINRALDMVSKATNDCPVTVYPPSEPTGHVLFEATGDGGTWRGKLQPAAVLEPGARAAAAADGDDEDEDEDDDNDEPLFNRGGAGKPEAAAADDNDDGIVDNDYPARASAKPAKAAKAPKRGVTHFMANGKNGTLCKERVGTSVGSGASNSLKAVTCTKCLALAPAGAAKKKAAKKPAPRKGK